MNETLKRSISGVIYIFLLIASIHYSVESFFVLFGIFLLITVFEFSSLVQLNKIVALLLAVILYGGWAYLVFTKFKIPQLAVYAVLTIVIVVAIKGIIFLFSDAVTSVSKISGWLFLIGYVILPFVIITQIPFGIKGYNPKILIGIFILIWTNDTFAYVVGKSIGKHKLFAKISPKKTIEGFVGGVCFAVLAGYLISAYYIGGSELTRNIWIVIALITGFLGTTGDLIESKFKRIAGVKDSGAIMPGHGGILDRLDSVIFVAPFVYLFYQILNYVTFS